MKKTITILIAMMMAAFSFGCEKGILEPDTSTVVSVSDDSKEKSEIQKVPSEPKTDEENAKWGKPHLPKDNVYINKQCGYEFTFPADWTGWYFVNDTIPDIAVVRFYGKSLLGTVAEKMLSPELDYGLTMFFILSEERANEGTYDSVTYIGTASGVDYYFATTTDVSMAPIIGDGGFYDESAHQQKLRQNDWKKAREMMKFYSYENLSALSGFFREI